MLDRFEVNTRWLCNNRHCYYWLWLCHSLVR